MKKLVYNKEEQQIIIELLIEDLRVNIDYLATNIETIPFRKECQRQLITPALDAMKKVQNDGAIILKKLEQAAILRCIHTYEDVNASVEYLEHLKAIVAKTKTK